MLVQEKLMYTLPGLFIEADSGLPPLSCLFIIAERRFFVTFPITRFSAPPVSEVRDSLRLFIPVRNRDSPPNIDVAILKISIIDI